MNCEKKLQNRKNKKRTAICFKINFKESIQVNGKDKDYQNQSDETMIKKKHLYPTDNKLRMKIIKSFKNIVEEECYELHRCYTKTLKKNQMLLNI
ncbi:MAG: hypothetical protein RL065_510 [Bacteroidota bacterium]|jgi:hypothetical protein